ncbi:MAG: PQQ-binding-like beta-propeller repeat protein [Planctomycetia bacterium]|nr:PQQ-binding-like beta-propeller repeat protein [Planctomycetia bacterium]
MNHLRPLFAVMLVALSPLVTWADDWPQWRGPHRDAISAETGLLQAWPAEGPKLVWQVNDVGAGYSTPAVVGDRLYVMGNEGTDNEFVQARSVADGSVVWTVTIGKVGPNRGPQYPGSRSTPTVDGDMLYVLGSDGDLTCLETASGSEVWKQQLRADFGGMPGQWAYSESPLVDGDTLICTPGGATATVLALDKRTGEAIWKAALPEADEAAYASAIIANGGPSGKQYIQFVQKGLVGLDAATGTPLWRYARTAEGSPANIPTPIVSDNFVYSAASRSGSGLVKLVEADGALKAEEVYFQKGLPAAIGGALKLGDQLYGTSGAGMMCVDFATGEVKWQERGIGTGSICLADGRIYLHGETGEAALIEPSVEGYKEHGRFTPPNQPDRGDAKAWAYPVVANGRLYLRDATSLWSFDIAR